MSLLWRSTQIMTYSCEQEGTYHFHDWAIEFRKTKTFIFLVTEPDLIAGILEDLVLIQTLVSIWSSFLDRMQSA